MALEPEVLFVYCFFGLLLCGLSHSKCPVDYRYRVETCVMEAQVAPQAGGGLPLITDPDMLELLCQRGILHKSIDCLRDLENRCGHNSTIAHELSMLFSLEDWELGQQLLCEDLHLFRDHFGCLSKLAPRISGCILLRTQMFRRELADVGHALPRTLHDITCNFAENIVSCLARPLGRYCPAKVVDTLVTALHRFLPPVCAPVPAVVNSQGGVDSSYVVETVITEGGDVEEVN